MHLQQCCLRLTDRDPEQLSFADRTAQVFDNRVALKEIDCIPSFINHLANPGLRWPDANTHMLPIAIHS